MRIVLASVLFCIVSIKSYTQLVFVIDSLPKNTPANDTIFIASSLNGWNPHDQDYIFTKNESGKLTLSVSTQKTTFEYKLCRGNWSKVESTEKGFDIKNRIFN